MKTSNLIKTTIILSFFILNLTQLWAEEPSSLVVSNPYDTKTLDPVQAGAGEDMNSISLFYDTLLRNKGETSELIPGLAKSWKVSNDGRTITFHLRKGVKFHDGTELTADDVKYSFVRLLETGLDAPSKKWLKLADADSMSVVDKYTCVLNLKIASPRIFGLLSHTMCLGITSRDYIEKHATKGDPYALNWMSSHVNGTGPWRLVKWSKNERLIVKRNDEYWGEKPHFNRLAINIIKDPSTAEMMIEKGDLDIATRLTLDQYEALEKVKGITISEHPTLKIVLVRINCSKKPFDDVRVRQALAYAINFDEIIKHVEMGRASRLYTNMPKGMTGWNPAVKPKYTYDPNKAKSLLKQAGLAKGFEANLIYSEPRYARYVNLVPLLISYWKDIGIELKPQKMAFSTQIGKMKNKDFNLALDVFNPYYNDAESTVLRYFHSEAWKRRGWSFEFYENKRLDELLDKALNNMNTEERIKQLQEAEQISVENAITIPLYQVKEIIAFRDDIKNVEWHATHFHKQYKDIYR